ASEGGRIGESRAGCHTASHNACEVRPYRVAGAIAHRVALRTRCERRGHGWSHGCRLYHEQERPRHLLVHDQQLTVVPDQNIPYLTAERDRLRHQPPPAIQPHPPQGWARQGTDQEVLTPALEGGAARTG